MQYDQSNNITNLIMYGPKSQNVVSLNENILNILPKLQVLKNSIEFWSTHKKYKSLIVSPSKSNRSPLTIFGDGDK